MVEYSTLPDPSSDALISKSLCSQLFCVGVLSKQIVKKISAYPADESRGFQKACKIAMFEFSMTFSLAL
jgi:hypothetical protein